MKLYDTKTAPNPRRVRIFAAEKDLAIPTVEVDLNAKENQTPEYRAKRRFISSAACFHASSKDPAFLIPSSSSWSTCSRRCSCRSSWPP